MTNHNVLMKLPEFIKYLDETVSKISQDLKLYHQLKTGGVYLIDENTEISTKISTESIWDSKNNILTSNFQYTGVFCHETSRFFYITLKQIYPQSKEYIEKYKGKWEKDKIIKEKENALFYWLQDESIICLVAKDDYNTNAKLGPVNAGDIFDISNGTRDYSSGYNKNPAKLARGSLLIPTTWRNIKYEIAYSELITMRPIEAISLREKNYPDYNPHYDYWEKMLNKDFPLRQTS